MSFPYKKGERQYDLYSRDIWELAKKHVRDPILAPFWTYDAVRLWKWNAERKLWIRFYDEPYTADGLWNAYVRFLILLRLSIGT